MFTFLADRGGFPISLSTVASKLSTNRRVRSSSFACFAVRAIRSWYGIALASGKN